MTGQPETRRGYYDRRFAALENNRNSFESHWRDLSEYIQPRRGRFLFSDTNKGSKKNGKIIDNTGTLALRTLRSGMMAGLTSPARPWFRLSTPDPELADFRGVREWLFEVQRRMLFVMGNSNFYNALGITYEELGLFGTGELFIKERRETVIWCHNLTAGTYFLALDGNEEVRTLYQKKSMTVGQVVSEYGTDNLSVSTKNLYDTNKLDNYIEVRHVIEVNRKRLPGSRAAKDMAFVSDHYESGAPAMEDQFLRRSGFNEFPAMSPRWDVNQGDIYGRSPGMDVLGDVKQLQQEQKRKAQGIDKLVNPPMVGGGVLANKPSTTLPGGLTIIEGTGAASEQFRAAYQVRLELRDITADIQDVRQRISRGFYEDLFLMLSQSDRREITAREVDERHEEKLLMLGPVLERLESELLDPAIDRIFGIMERGGLLPPPPPELQGMELKVEYVSILAQAQRRVQMGSLEAFTGYVGAIAGLKPDVVDKVDFEQSIDEVAGALGVPPKIVRSDDDVEDIRISRAEQEAQAQRALSMQNMIESGKTLSETDTAGKNALTDAVAAAAP